MPEYQSGGVLDFEGDSVALIDWKLTADEKASGVGWREDVE